MSDGKNFHNIDLTTYFKVINLCLNHLILKLPMSFASIIVENGQENQNL